MAVLVPTRMAASSERQRCGTIGERMTDQETLPRNASDESINVCAHFKILLWPKSGMIGKESPVELLSLILTYANDHIDTRRTQFPDPFPSTSRRDRGNHHYQRHFVPDQ